MISSFTISVVFFAMKKAGHALPFAQTVLFSVAFTTICWLIAAFVTPPTSRERLIAFYTRCIRRARAGRRFARKPASAWPTPRATATTWARRRSAGFPAVVDDLVVALRDRQLPLRPHVAALMLTAVFVVSGVVLLYVTNTLWDRRPSRLRPCHGSDAASVHGACNA